MTNLHKFVIVFLMIFSLTETANSFVIKNYSPDDGLSQGDGYSIVQDETGYIWIGTQDGLNRFDGITFKVYTTQDGLPSNFITSLDIDDNGNILIGTILGFAIYDGMSFHKYIKNDKDFSNQINVVKHTGYGTLIGTDKGLHQFRDGNFNLLNPEKVMLRSYILSIEEDTNENLYIGTTKNGLIIYKDGKLVSINKNDGLPSGSVKSIEFDEKRDGVWIGTTHGIVFYRERKVRSVIKNSRLSNIGITALHVERNGRLWIGTEDGINIFQNGKYSLYRKSNGILGNNILTFFEDREKNIWSGLTNGITVFTPSKFETITEKDGLRNDSIFDINSDKESNIWAGTENGIAVLKNKTGNILNYTVEHGLPSNSISSIVKDKDGTIWFGSFAGGLTKYFNNRFSTYNIANGFPNNDVLTLSVDHDNMIWCGMRRSGIAIFDPFKELVVNKISEDKIGKLTITALYRDSQDNVWFGFPGGMGKIDGKNNVSLFGKKEGLICEVVLSIVENEDRLWIATCGKGLYVMKNDTIIDNITTEDGLPHNCIYDIMKDGNGNLWLPSNKGIIVFDGKDSFVTYTKQDGLPSNECNSPGNHIDKSGTFWFSTMGGIAYLDPLNIYQNRVIPNVVIENVAINNTSVDFENRSNFDYNQTNYRFKFTALSFSSPRHVKFKFRLDGYDEEGKWTKRQESRFAEYTNLDPGNYTFRVIACNNDNVWNMDGATYSFSISSPYWTTWWFYGLLIIGTAVIIYLMYHLRVYQLRKKQQELEALVNKRTSQLNKEKIRVENANSELALANAKLYEMEEKVRKMFGKYVSEPVASKVLEMSEKELLKGEEKEITVLFCDIRDFTTLFEDKTPNDIVERLNEYFSAMAEIIEKHGGIIDKFIGDAIMALWGAPISMTEDAKSAVTAAINMVDAVKKLNSKWHSLYGQKFHIGIGIETGNAIVGNIGSHKKIEFTVIGDVVNIASRIEGLTKNDYEAIYIGENCYERVKESFKTAQLPVQKIKGKRDEIKVYSVLGYH